MASPPPAGMVCTGAPAIACEAECSAACSNESDGWLMLIPPAAGVPETGPAFCCITCASSWASTWRPPGVSGSYAPLRNTTSLPTVYACALIERADSSALAPVCTRTSEKSAPIRSSRKDRAPGSTGEPPPEPTTSWTGDRSSSSCWPSSALTLSLPAMRCRLRTADGMVSVRGAGSGPLGRSDARRVTATIRSYSWASIISSNHKLPAPGSQAPCAHNRCPFGQAPALWRSLRGRRQAGTRMAPSDQALAQGVRDGVSAVAQVQPAGDVVDDVLHRPFGQEELAAHLGGVEPLGEQAQHAHLPVGQAREGEAARGQHLPLQAADLAQQAAQEIGREGALARGGGPDARQQALGARLRAAQHAAGARLRRRQEPAVVEPGRDHHDVLDAAAPERADLAHGLVVHLVHHDDADDVGAEPALVDELDAMPAQLAGDTVPRQGVAGGDEDRDPISCRLLAGEHRHAQHTFVHCPQSLAVVTFRAVNGDSTCGPVQAEIHRSLARPITTVRSHGESRLSLLALFGRSTGG